MEKDLFIEMLKDPDVAEAIALTTIRHLGGGKIPVRFCVLPGGKAPVRMSNGAVGFDLHARAVVSSTEMWSEDPRLRKPLFDFKIMPDDKSIEDSIKTLDDGSLVYVLKPGCSQLFGVGVAFDLPYELFQWVSPRSGLSTRFLVTLGNAPGTIDPDYKGEAGVILMNHSDKEFIVTHNMRISQMVHGISVVPTLIEVATLDDLSISERGSGGFGSTGLY